MSPQVPFVRTDVVLFIWTAVILVFGWAPPSVADQPRAEIVLQQGHSNWVLSVASSPDGRIVATAGDDRTARLWDVATGVELRQIRGHTSPVYSVAFSPDGRTLLTGSLDNTARLWDVESGRELRKFIGHSGWVVSVAFSPDGRSVLTGSWDGTARLWDAASGHELRRLVGHTDKLLSAVFSSDGLLVLTGSKDKTARLWEAKSGRELRHMGHQEAVISVAFSPDGRTVLTGSDDKTARLWDVTSGRELRRLTTGQTSEVSAVAFSPDGRMALTGGKDKIVRLWDAASARELREFTGHRAAVRAVLFSRDGRTVFTSGEEKIVREWDVASGREIGQLSGRMEVLESVAFSPDGRSLLTGGLDKTARLWDVESGRQLREFTGHSGGIWSVAFSPDGRMVATGSEDQTARLWDTATGRERAQLIGHSDWIASVAFSPDSRMVLTGSSDNSARLWDATSGRELRQFIGHSGPINSVAFSSDNRMVLTGASDATARLWDAGSGHEMRQLLHEITIGSSGSSDRSTRVTSVGFSPDGKAVVTGTEFSKVRLWDAASGRELRVFVGHESNVNSVAFSSDGQEVLTGSSDRTARLWDVATGRELRKFTGLLDIVNSVALSRDGQRLVAASNDGIARVFDITSGTLGASMISFADGGWLTITPEGFFDASSSKAAQNLNIVRGFEVYSIDQFRDALFRPDLVKAKLAGDPDGLVRAAAAKLDLAKVVESGNAPKVAIGSPADGSAAAVGEVYVEATVTEQGGGVGRIEWRLNGQPVGIDTRGLERVQQSTAALAPGMAGAVIKISQKMVLDAGDNLVEVVAHNSKGLVASQPAKITIKATGSVVVTKPRLFVMAVGVNDYYDGRLKLNFAVPDARSVAAAFEKAGTGFYQSVKTVTVLDGDVTRANLEKVFTQLSDEVKITDVFVFFIAGHGRTMDGHYYFLPQDFRYRDQSSYAENGLSQEQWQKWITLVQARKSVLIYDTCESGTVTADNLVVASRGTQSIEEQAVAYQKLRDATGKTILAASTDTQPALEGYHGHGVFSYVVMEALEKAQTNASGLIEVTGLISYVDDRVPDLSYQAFHQRQIPQNKMLGSNFAIAKPSAMLLETAPTNATPATKMTSADAATAMTSNPATKPTHVVIATTDVFDAAGSGAVVEQLLAGTEVTLVETSAGWTAIARNGRRLGFVKNAALLRLQ